MTKEKEEWLCQKLKEHEISPEQQRLAWAGDMEMIIKVNYPNFDDIDNIYNTDIEYEISRSKKANKVLLKLSHSEFIELITMGKSILKSQKEALKLHKIKYKK